MVKNWKLRKAISKKAEAELSDYPELVRKLLFYRGIKTKAEAEKYLQPDYERDLLDPFLMKDMAKAVDRLFLALERKEKIIIFGDYDADGVPGSAMLALFFHKIGYHNFEVFIPDRNNEAYGLSPEKIEDFTKQGVKLIITIDCGITDVTEVKLANKKGIDVVITDHHLAPAELPSAYAIVDAKQLDDHYPEKMLAGSGVMYKFICALLLKNRFNIPTGWEKWLLDLVVIATVSDMVPLTGENRLLAYYGLKVLRQTKRLGLLALLNIIKTRPANVTEDDISFMLGPRINSASRMSHASQAYYLLTTYDEVEAVTIAKHLEDKNKARREAVEVVIKGVAE
ncbi:MAG: DHH family phosphoesterase, partial [Candidatus Paceibacterota bacterium]